jgi:EmrB/QacA subfamily drug resistance transporter
MAERVLGAGTTRQHRWLLLGCCLCLGITAVDVTVVNVALPVLSRSLHTDLTGLQWVIDGYMLVLAALLVLSGSIGDRVGRRRMLRLGLVSFGVASAACSLAPTVVWLVIFRVLQGIAAALLVPNALSTLTNVITESGERARAIGIWSAVFGIAAAAGPICGGLLVQGIGWRSIFWVNVPVVAVALALITRFAPETKAPVARRLDLPGQALILVAMAALVAGLIEAPTLGWTAPGTLGLLALAVFALAGFIAAERRAVQPLIDLRFFASPPFSGAASIAVLAFAVFSGLLLVSTLYLQEVRGASPVEAGLELVPALGMMAIVGPLVGRLIAVRGSHAVLTLSGLLMAAGTAILAILGAHAPYGLLALAYGLTGLGLATVNPPITHAAVSGMPVTQAGVASAIASSSRQLGNALGVAVIGSLLSSLLSARLAAIARMPSLGASARAALRAASRNGGELRSASAQAHALFGGAFVHAAEAGWWAATGFGVAISLIAFLTTARAGARTRSSPAPAGS